MDVLLVIRKRLEELGAEQRDLAAAAEVTESYISQLLTRRKPPPAPSRTDIYGKMENFLKVSSGELSRLANLQREEEMQRKFAEPLTPLFREVRELVLRKCKSANRRQVQVIFEKQPFGELERLVTQKLLEVTKGIAKEELRGEDWLRAVAHASNQHYEQVRVSVLEFLDTDLFNLSIEHCVAFLEPLIDSWDIDLATFEMEIVLNRKLTLGPLKKFEFVERPSEPKIDEERGLREFLKDASLSGDATEEEIAFLRRLKFQRRQPTPLYYYRELQNLRDPLHFRTP